MEDQTLILKATSTFRCVAGVRDGVDGFEGLTVRIISQRRRKVR